MKIKPIKQVFKESISDKLPKPLDDLPQGIHEHSLNIRYSTFYAGYLLGAATAILEDLPESKEDILTHECVQPYLITEDSNATS